jgi:hypothetical protein
MKGMNPSLRPPPTDSAPGSRSHGADLSPDPRGSRAHPVIRWALSIVVAGTLVTASVSTTSAGAGTSPTITTASLLAEMTELAGIAEFPQPAYTCQQFSSYDRASRSPEENWFANEDRGHYLRVEERAGRKEYVMMDAAGPGAVVRIWSANPSGTLRVYLDGSERPALEASATQILGGEHPGLPTPIAGTRALGWNLYFPIPYADHCKVTVDSGDLYYHLNYRTYEADTRVETFHPDQLQSLAGPIRQIAAQLADPRQVGAAHPGRTETFRLLLQPGGTERVIFTGPGAITRAAVRLSAVNRDTALRGVVVRGEFDGELTVETPLGDFLWKRAGDQRVCRFTDGNDTGR